MTGTNLKEGDKAHAEWGGGKVCLTNEDRKQALMNKVEGTVAEVKSDGPLEIESKGKTVSKEGTSDNAAVRHSPNKTRRDPQLMH